MKSFDHQGSLALMRLGEDRFALGIGPFRSSECAETEGAFYVNRFLLEDSKPWMIPERLFVGSAAECLAFLEELDLLPQGAAEDLKIRWDESDPGLFKMAYRRIRETIKRGELDKMVPAYAELGSLEGGGWGSLLDRLLKPAESMWSYMWAPGAREKSFAGMTPELLLSKKGKEVKSMALAGTARKGREAEFEEDPKELREHDFVSRYVKHTLEKFGEVRAGDLEAVAFGKTASNDRGMAQHMKTDFVLNLDAEMDLDELLKSLHPTPAVGYFPKQAEHEKLLMEYRKALDVPEHFGAPFGFVQGDEAVVVVAIRALMWEGDEVFLPAGCGVLQESVFDHEWDELGQKRQMVKVLLGVS